MKKKMLILGMIGVMALSSYAQTLVTATGAYSAFSDGTTSLINDYHASIGYNGYAPTLPAASIVLTFALPSLSPDQSFRSFTFTGSSDFTGSTSVTSIYGLGTRSASSALGTDYYAGINDTRPDATLLSSSFISPVTERVQLVTTADFSSYINSLYAGGVPSANFLVLRLSQNVPNDASNAYDFNGLGTGNQLGFSGNLAEVGSNWSVPYISYDIVAAVPEPSTYFMAVIGFILLGLVLRSKREAQLQ